MLPSSAELKRQLALFLDVDGTLLDIAPTPDAVVVPDRLRHSLVTLHEAMGGALAFVSGRAIEQIDRLFAPFRLPAAGQHGGEIRLTRDGSTIDRARSAKIATIRDRLQDFARSRPGLLIEYKGMSVSAHYRNAAWHRDALFELVTTLVADHAAAFELLQAHMAFDIKPRAVSKESAVAFFMAAPPFAGRLPLFIGDDRTDEDGFRAALALQGRAIRVGLDGDSIAPHRVATPNDIRQWLYQAADELALPS